MTLDVQRWVFTFLIFLISESSSDGAAAGLAWIFSLSLSSPAICQRSSQKPVWSHLLRFFSLTFPECKHNDWANGAGPVTARWHCSLELCSLHCWRYLTVHYSFHLSFILVIWLHLFSYSITKLEGWKHFDAHIQMMHPPVLGRLISVSASQVILPQTSAFQSLFPHLLSVVEVA